MRPVEFSLAVTFDMVGATWDRVNELHSAYRFHERWPAGMLCHITGATEDSIRSQGIWTTPEAEAEFFKTVAVNIITDAIDEIGVAQSPEGAVDFEPVSRQLRNLVLGPLSQSFVGIGADDDASAIRTLGGDPVALDLELSSLRPESLDALAENLAPEDSIPADLVLFFDEESADGEHLQTQVWRSLEAAEAFMQHAGIAVPQDPAVTVRHLKRISFGSPPYNGLWFDRP